MAQDVAAEFLVGVSGGPDSVALLDALVRFGYRPHVCHLNHKLRGVESDGDAEFVRKLAGKYGLPVTIKSQKETLIKIVEVLELNSYDGASLFNLDFKEEINKIVQVSSKVNENLNLQQMLDMITSKLVATLDVNYASIFIFNKANRNLYLRSVNVPNLVVALIEKIINIPLTTLKLNIDSIEDQKNYPVKSFIENKILESRKMIDFCYPVIKNKTVLNILSKWINFKLVLHVPLTFNNEKLGVLGISWNKDSLTDGDYLITKAFADEISIAIYNAQRYEELQEKYNNLLVRVNGN